VKLPVKVTNNKKCPLNNTQEEDRDKYSAVEAI